MLGKFYPQSVKAKPMEPLSTKALANEFLKIAEKKKPRISAMKLQKLLYFAHGWHLAFTDTPAVNEKVGAWDWGPVFPSIYHEFKEYGKGPIDRLAEEHIPGTLDFKVAEAPPEVEQIRGLIDRVWEVYGKYTAIQLSNMTHQVGTPWYKTVEPFSGNIPKNLIIDDEVIKEHFKKKLKEANGG